jgi:hypothetical protein
MDAGKSGAGSLGKRADAAEDALKHLAEHGTNDFTPEQLEALTEVMDAWNSVKGFITIMRYAGATLKWCVAFALAWAAFKAGLFGAFPK